MSTSNEANERYGMATKRETVEEKGWRLFSSGAVGKVRDGLFDVVGDNGRYRVEDGSCSCPSFSRCSHEEAVDLSLGIASPPEGMVEIPAELLAAYICVAQEARVQLGPFPAWIEMVETQRATRRAANGEEEEELEGLFA